MEWRVRLLPFSISDERVGKKKTEIFNLIFSILFVGEGIGCALLAFCAVVAPWTALTRLSCSFFRDLSKLGVCLCI
jgi:hypothetical protein